MEENRGNEMALSTLENRWNDWLITSSPKPHDSTGCYNPLSVLIICIMTETLNILLFRQTNGFDTIWIYFQLMRLNATSLACSGQFQLEMFLILEVDVACECVALHVHSLHEKDAALGLHACMPTESQDCEWPHETRGTSSLMQLRADSQGCDKRWLCSCT